MAAEKTGNQNPGLGCLFPALNRSSRSPKSQRRRQQVIDLGRGLTQHDPNQIGLLQLAWGLVLGLYTGSSEVAFLHIHAGGHRIELSLCGFDLSSPSQPERWQQQLNSIQDLNHTYYGKVNTAFSDTHNPTNEAESFQDLGTVEFIDVILHVHRKADTATLVLDYNESIMYHNQAISVLEAFKLAILQLNDRPTSNLNELDLCSTHDINRLCRWNPALTYPQPICVHEAILQQCDESPDSVAIDSWDGSVTYRELDQLSARLAQELVALGVTTDTLIPLCFEKSKWAIVAVLGVMRAGGAYAFIDPTYPVARMASVCEDLKAKYLVCSATHPAVGGTLGLHTVVVSEGSLPTHDEPQNRAVNPGITPQNAVYAAFSSGSTGKPKGVVIEHGAFYLKAMANKEPLSLSSESRIMQFANYVFDVSNRDILYTLMFGGCICVPSDSDRFHNLMEFMRHKRINWASLTPFLANLLDPNGLPDLRQLVLCGEAMSPHHLETWGTRVNLINAYGPSETVTISSIRAKIDAGVHCSNIGHASGSNIWIVDVHDQNRLLPVGAVGELLIESPSIGQGYINNASETNASFLPMPPWLSSLRQSTFGRVYRTGDLGRYESDGSICFMGRKDSQVKIRGQRVELGEVEHHIQQSLDYGASIPVVVDLIKPQSVKTALLVAFLAVKQHAANVVTDKEAALRRLIPSLEKTLSKVLPVYMLPSEFIIIDKIPMTATGKSNRRQLREMYAQMTLDELRRLRSPDNEERALVSDLELQLQHIWATILDIDADSIGPDESFFRLGGDSIAAMRVSALSRSNGLDLSVADVLEYKNLGKIAEVVSLRSQVETDVQISPFSLVDLHILDNLPASLRKLQEQNMVEDIVPATATQMFFLIQWSLSSFCCVLNGEINIDRLRTACQTMVSQHSSLRTVYFKLGDTTIQATLKDIDTPFDHICSNQPLEEVSQSATDLDLEESPLSGNPLVRFTLISRSKTEHALMVRLSHAQYDGYSSPLLFNGISTVYNNPENATIPRPTPYSHYVYACDRHRTREAFEFWRRNLQGSSMTAFSTLPSYCRDKKPIDIRQGASGKVPIPPQEITVSALVNAAFSLILSRIFQRADVVFGVVMNNRDIPLKGVETMLGSCININPFRVHLPRSKTALDLCHALHDQYVQVSRHSCLNLPDILANATDWEPKTKLGFMINHLDGTKRPAPLALDGAPCMSFGWKANINLSDQVLVRSVTTAEELQVQVLTSDQVMGVESARGLARRLVETAQVLAASPSLLLSSLPLQDLDTA